MDELFENAENVIEDFEQWEFEVENADGEDQIMESEYKCLGCGEPCDLIPEKFDYSATHCSHGEGGTHETGFYITACCFADYEDE